MKLLRVLMLGALALQLGCGTYAEETPLNAPPRPLAARPAAAVEVYSSSPPTRAHVDVALIRAVQSAGLDDQGLAVMIAAIREKAGQMGCDAVFISGASERAGAEPGSKLYLLDPGSHLLMATCVAYLDAPREALSGVSSAGTSAPPVAASAAPIALSAGVSRAVRR